MVWERRINSTFLSIVELSYFSSFFIVGSFQLPLLIDLEGSNESAWALPDSVDWRARGHAVSPIKNQGACGSCWAFAATAALESHVSIATGKLMVLSVQELVSCVPNPRHCGGIGGCGGSTAELAYDFVAQHGMVDEWHFSYQSFYGQQVNCTLLEEEQESLFARILRRTTTTKQNYIPNSVASIVGFANLPSNQYNTLMAAVAFLGPVVVSVAASGWGLYQGGIYDDDAQTDREINHAVVLEGYGKDQETGQEYWLVRNSWGPMWGK